jgi:hypothetical protein
MVEQIYKGLGLSWTFIDVLCWTRMLIEVGLCEYYMDIIVEQNKNVDTLIGYYVMRQQDTFHNLQPWFHLWPTTHNTRYQGRLSLAQWFHNSKISWIKI